MKHLERFSERLRSLMSERGDTLASLGDVVGLSKGTISKYINGKVDPKANTIQAMAKHYGVNPVWLMGVDVEKYVIDAELEFKNIPVLGTIACGQPLLASEHIEGYEAVLKSSKSDFCLRAKGDSMIGARIHDGDIVFVRQQSDVENGEIAVVLINGFEATLKRVYKREDEIILHAENSSYLDMIFSKKDINNIKIMGKVVAVKFETE